MRVVSLVLHLHRHGAAVIEASAMHLGQGGRRRGVRVELGEVIRDRTEVFLDDSQDDGCRSRGHSVLQLRQLAHVRVGKEVGTSGNELPELQEPAAQAHRGVVQVASTGLVRPIDAPTRSTPHEPSSAVTSPDLGGGAIDEGTPRGG